MKKFTVNYKKKKKLFVARDTIDSKKWKK
jgi:hypothetical protein